MFYRLHSSIYLLLFFLLLQGCSDNKPSDNGGGTDVIPESKFHNFLSYKVTIRDPVTKKNRITQIKALSIENLEETIDVDSSDDGSIRILSNGFQSGNYDESSYTISGYHTTNLIYINGSQLKHLPVFQAAQPLPEQLSSEAGGYYICVNDYRRANDYSNPNNSRLVYKKMTSIEDLENCHLKHGDWYMVSALDDESVLPKKLPVELNYVVDAVHAKHDGSLLAWIVVADGKLKKYDKDFNNGQNISLNTGPISVSSYAQLLTRTSGKQFLINSDNRLFIYDPYSNQVLNNSLSFSANLNEVLGSYKVADGEKAFFSVNLLAEDQESVVSSEIYSIDLNTGITQSLVTEAGALGKLVITNAYLLYGIDADASWPLGKRLRKIPKQGGQSVDVSILADADGIKDLYGGDAFFYVNASKGNVYQLERFNQEQTTGTVHDYHRIIGATYRHNLNPAKFFLDVDKLIVVQSDPISGAKNLHALSVGTDEMKVLGTLPDEAFLEGDFEFVEALGHAHALIGIYHQGIRDLYYFDVSKANSLKRLGVHTSENENGIYYKNSHSPGTQNGHISPRTYVPVF